MAKTVSSPSGPALSAEDELHRDLATAMITFHEAVARRLGVTAADQRVLAAVRQAFLDYGFDTDDADLRADATFAAGIGFLHLAGEQPNVRAAARREGLLEIMLKH